MSRCQTPNDPPLDWHWYVDEDGHCLPKAEMMQCLAGLADAERTMRIGELIQRLRAACRGDLLIGDELVPLRRDPEMWEIRWSFSGAKWRMYHGEPPEIAGGLLALLFHEKETSGTSADITHAQNVFIHQARLRYVTGRPRHWGIA